MKEQGQRGLMFSIMFASLVLSGSIVFFGLQMTQSGQTSTLDLEDEIERGIDDYVQEKTADAAQGQQAAAKPKIVEGDYADDDAFIGDEDAPVTIVEFSDFQCPFCRKFYNDAYPQIKENYVDTGKVKFVYRDYPLNFHADALPAAMAAECARDQEGDEMLFAMHDKIFDGQNALSLSGTVNIPRESLTQYADELGLDVKEFDECVDSEKFKDEVNADLVDGSRAGITGTPGFLIEGELVSGAQPYSVFESVIESKLNN